MGRHSAIEWTHHTFNPWWGCVKVSPGCQNCYAETWAKRVGSQVWGASAERRFFGDKHWREPLSWDRAAATSRVRERVFCSSMADVFEPREDLNEARTRLWSLIELTPNLDWLLLTKRPGQIASLAPWADRWPSNVWIGATVEDQQRADERIPQLLMIPAAVRFLSCEPLLGPLALGMALSRDSHRIDWVIAGGESGGKARPARPEWFRSLRDQCATAGVPFLFKQWGNWRPDAKRGHMVRVSKHIAGRDLDGRSHDEYPRP